VAGMKAFGLAVKGSGVQIPSAPLSKMLLYLGLRGPSRLTSQTPSWPRVREKSAEVRRNR